MPRYFTLAEAQALIPAVEERLRRAVSLKASLAEAAGELQAESERIRLTGGALVDRRKLLDAASRRDTAVAHLRETLASIQECGCTVKDLDMGLLDFPTLFRGEEACLCWRLGEPEIRFWHRTQEGYRGRKPIDREFLDEHRGDS
jgi:hypothetical protein